MNQTRIVFALLMMAVCILSTVSAAERRFEKKFNVHAGGTLDLRTDVGTVKVTGGSSDEVSITADIRGREREVDGFTITAEQSGDGVSVTGESKSRGSWFFNSNDGIDVEYTIRVPKSYNLKIRTSGGDLYISEVAGTVEGKTSGGNVDASALEGRVDLQTSGGNVKAERVKGDVKLETSGGEVSASKIVGNVDAGTSGGNVNINDVEGSVRAETSGGDVTVSVRGGNKGVYAESSGGDIEIAVAKSSGATIDATTSGGDVVCDMPVTVEGRISEGRIKGTVNGGGPKIYAHTSGGNVRIRAVD
jgi:hypothetical protein